MKRTAANQPSESTASSWSQPQAIPHAHFVELRHYLANQPTSTSKGTLGPLSTQELLELSTDVYDELVRRKKNLNGAKLPFLPARQDFPQNRNNVRKSLATSQEFEHLPSQVYREITQRYPEFIAKSVGPPTSTDFPALPQTPRFSVSNAPGPSYPPHSAYTSSASSRRSSSHETTPTSDDLSLRSSQWNSNAWAAPHSAAYRKPAMPPRFQRDAPPLRGLQAPPPPLPLYTTKRLHPRRAPPVSCRCKNTPVHGLVAFGATSSGPAPSPDAPLRHSCEDPRHPFRPFSVGAPSPHRKRFNDVLDLSNFLSSTTIFGTSRSDISGLTPDPPLSRLPYPTSENSSRGMSPLPLGGISPLPLGDLQVPYMQPSHVLPSSNGVLSQQSMGSAMTPPFEYANRPVPPEYAFEYTRPQGEYTAEFEVQDFGWGFGVASGTGLAPASGRDERVVRGRYRQKEDLSDPEMERYEGRPRRGSFVHERGGGSRRGRGPWSRGGGYNNHFRQPPPPLTITPPLAHYRGLPSNDRPYYAGQQPMATYISTGFELQHPPPPVFVPAGPLQPPVPVPLSNLSFPLDPLRWHLLGQLEYYLSPQNLAQDFYLRQRMDSRGWIDIPLLASFRRIQQLTMDIALVKEVLNLSNVLEVFDESVRMSGWEQFVLPNSVLSTVEGLPLGPVEPEQTRDPSSLLGQLEHYLGPQNMSLDFYLRQQMDSRGWIHIPLLAGFARIRELTSDVGVVKAALSSSDRVDVLGDFVRVKAWEQYVLPNAPESVVELVPAQEEDIGEYVYEDEDDDEEDVVFVMGQESGGNWTPERR